jgi:hypothetical protein
VKLKEFLENEMLGCQFDGEDSALTIVCPNRNLDKLDINKILLRFIATKDLRYEQGEFHPKNGMIVADQGRKEYILKVTRYNGHRIFFEFKPAQRPE